MKLSQNLFEKTKTLPIFYHNINFSMKSTSEQKYLNVRRKNVRKR